MSVTFKLFLAGVVFTAVALAGAPVHAVETPPFGTSTFARSIFSYVDTNGQHHPQDVCDTSSGGCNTSMPYAHATATTALGASSGSVYGTSIGPGGAGHGHVLSYWWDTFTITSGTLPFGTPVTVEAHIDLAAVVVPSLAAPSPYTRAQAGITLGGPDAPAVAFASTQEGFELSNTGTFTQLVGQEIMVFGGFYLNTDTLFFLYPDTGSADASALYTLRVLTDGASYSTASGTSYFAPVPVAPAWGLLLSGLAVLRWRRGARRTG